MASERIQRRIDLLLDEADQAVSKSDWVTVADRAQNVLALDPDNKDAATFVAAADRASGGSDPQPTVTIVFREQLNGGLMGQQTGEEKATKRKVAWLTW